MIYLGICMSIATCIEDISLTAANLNGSIARQVGIKKELKQLIVFHLDCYKYVASSNFLFQNVEPLFITIFFQNIGNAWRNHSCTDFLPDLHIWWANCCYFIPNWDGKYRIMKNIEKKTHVRPTTSPLGQSWIFRICPNFRLIWRQTFRNWSFSQASTIFCAI